MVIDPDKKDWLSKLHTWTGLLAVPLITVAILTGVLLNHAGDWFPFLKEHNITLALDPFQSDHLLRGGADGLYLSVDSGQRWEAIATMYPLEDVVSVAFAPDEKGTVYTLMRRGGLIKSVDGGQIWERVALPIDPFTQGGELKRVMVGNAGAIYIDTSYGVIRSNDGGGSWLATSYDVERRGLPLLLRSFHTGRFYGRMSLWLFDLSVLGMLIVIYTGILIWRRTI